MRKDEDEVRVHLLLSLHIPNKWAHSLSHEAVYSVLALAIHVLLVDRRLSDMHLGVTSSIAHIPATFYRPSMVLLDYNSQLQIGCDCNPT